MRLTDHKTVGLQYGITAAVFLAVGFLLMLLMRWQLAWPTQPLPPALASIATETNAPGGYMLPEFYNQLVAMHGTVMIFLAVVPLAAGAFGNYLVPLQIGARDMAFPRLNAASYWIYLAAGAAMMAGFAAPGGAPNSGWTSYPPLAVLATRGQDFWLAGIFLVGVSAALNSVNAITTIVQLRARGLSFSRLPFFVWAQLVTALLLLLAFPALQAASILQLMDRNAGSSFFMPAGLIVGGVPLAGPDGGGNPLLWQHLFWFLAHPEVYVLILPAMGIVAEIIANNARRPLWGYPLMVGAVLFLGVMSILVWAHHMFLTGMRPELSAFFQVTTMIVSVPSVILVSALILSLWGGSIRFTVPMLFALAFLPMFGIGGLTGLPLGLAASDVALHDTYYVVGHFHYLVAPGTLFALFAGIYHWFPKITGRRTIGWLGHVHFWGSLVTMNAIFLPMFAMGLMGVNRRLYDAGLQYAHAQPSLAWNETMTWSAMALGIFQIPFLVNLFVSARRGAPASDNPWDATSLEWATASPPPHGNFPIAPSVARGAYEYGGSGEGRDFLPQFDRDGLGAAAHAEADHPQGAIPYTYEPRPDSGLTNIRLGMWLFLASEAMLFASLFSAFVLLKTGSDHWPTASIWRPDGIWLGTALLAAATLGLAGRTRVALAASAIGAFAFLAVMAYEFGQLAADGFTPASNLLVACWYALGGFHLLHVLGGGIAAAWLAGPAWNAREAGPARFVERLGAVRLYWYLVDAVWLAILIAFSFA